MSQLLSAVHPGEILLLDFLEPLGITQYRLAKETAVPPRRINEIIQGHRAITADTALRLAKFFGTSEMFWLNLQARYDLDVQKQKLRSKLAGVRTLSSLTKPPTRITRAKRSRSAAAKSGATPSTYQRKAK
jgi:addiction module HigA family antidote